MNCRSCVVGKSENLDYYQSITLNWTKKVWYHTLGFHQAKPHSHTGRLAREPLEDCFSKPGMNTSTNFQPCAAIPAVLAGGISVSKILEGAN